MVIKLIIWLMYFWVTAIQYVGYIMNKKQNGVYNKVYNDLIFFKKCQRRWISFQWNRKFEHQNDLLRVIIKIHLFIPFFLSLKSKMYGWHFCKKKARRNFCKNISLFGRILGTGRQQECKFLPRIETMCTK